MLREIEKIERARVLIHCTVDEIEVELSVDSELSLDDSLRKELKLCNLKEGFSHIEDKVHNVLIDGKIYDSCIYRAVWADGKEIRTMGGIVIK